MARNPEKMAYLTLAIRKDAPLYQALLADAETSGQPLSVVAHLRLADYYRGSRQSETVTGLPERPQRLWQSPETNTMQVSEGQRPLEQSLETPVRKTTRGVPMP
jgi:hypothetical protein